LKIELGTAAHLPLPTPQKTEMADSCPIVGNLSAQPTGGLTVSQQDFCCCHCCFLGELFLFSIDNSISFVSYKKGPLAGKSYVSHFHFKISFVTFSTTTHPT